MSDEIQDCKQEVIYLIDLALKAKTPEEKNKLLLEIKDITKNNLENM